MAIEISKEWFEKRSAQEGDLEVGAGRRRTMTLNLSDEEIAVLEDIALKALPAWAQSRLTIAAELLECLKVMVAETVEYATINKLGDPEQQHNIKWARWIIAKAEGKS